MKNFNIKKATSDQLRKKISKIIRVQDRTNAFDNFLYDIDVELNRRNRAAIYREACRVLKNRGRNQFAAAAIYADAVMNGSDYFSSDDHHEIGSFYTKSGNPVIVLF